MVATKEEIQELAERLGGIVRGGGIYQGHAKEKILMQERYERDLLNLRHMMVVMWRDALAQNPDFSCTVDAQVYDLMQETKDFPIGVCAKCGLRQPVDEVYIDHRPLTVCAWKCEDEDR